MKDFDLTILYYTSNHLEKENPFFVKNTKKQLLKAIGNYPLISISHEPMDFGENVCVGDIGRSHLNIYKQIMIGCQHAKTKYVAMAEDDILYSYEHFHTAVPEKEMFLYDMNKLSLFTWTDPPLFSFRHDRMVVNQLIAPRKMLQEAMEERFARLEELLKKGGKEENIIRHWGDPGRYEKALGVTVRPTGTFMCACPSIVFTHEYAFGYLSRGKNKSLGSLRIVEVPFWGRAEEVLKLYYEQSVDKQEENKPKGEMNEQKRLWEKLAKEDPRYYIYVPGGHEMTEERFRASGEHDYTRFIAKDEILSGRLGRLGQRQGQVVVMDLGCGIGRMTEFMAKGFKTVIGVDISGEMIRQGKERLKRWHNIKWLETDGQSIPIEPDSVDFVFSYTVFQHMRSREMAEKSFEEVYRVLKPKGIFKVLMLNDRGLERNNKMNRWWSGVVYDGETIKALCKKVGFNLLKMEYFDETKRTFWLWLEKI